MWIFREPPGLAQSGNTTTMLLHLRYFCPLQILCKSSAEFVPAPYSGGVAAGVHLETWYKLLPPKTVEIDRTVVPSKQLLKTNTILFLNYLGGVPVNYLSGIALQLHIPC